VEKYGQRMHRGQSRELALFSDQGAAGAGGLELLLDSGHQMNLNFREHEAALQAMFQDLLHVPAALEDGNHVQRFRVGPVDN
jgi:hypothetical protein